MFIIVSRSARRQEYAELFLSQTPLLLLLVASIAMTLWSIVSIFHFYRVVAKDPLSLLQVAGISWPCKPSTCSQVRESPFANGLQS